MHHASKNNLARIVRIVSGLLIGLAMVPAWAHNGVQVAMGSFATGFEHPLLGWDHLLAMLAVGLWASQQKRALMWAMPIAFPMMMVLGAAVALAGLHLPAVEQGIAASVLILGLLVAFAVRLPQVGAVSLIGVFALLHGYAHGVELPAAGSAALYGAGFVAATVLLHVAGLGAGLYAQSAFKNRMVRAAGSGMALTGLFLLMRAV